MRLWTPPKPSIRKRKSLLVEGHKTNWLNCGQKHGHTGFFIRGRLCDGHILFQHWIEDPEDAEDFWRSPIPSWFPSVEDYPGLSYEFSSVTYLTDTAGGLTFLRPLDWTDGNNKIECLGGGGPGGGSAGANAGGGGGSCGYSRVNNFTLSINNPYTIGTGAGSQATFIGSPNFCKALGGGAGGAPTAGVGASIVGAVGDVTTAGTDGGIGWVNVGGGAGCGAGGAGAPGPTGSGSHPNDATQAIGSDGGFGDIGLGGVGGLGVSVGKGGKGGDGGEFGIFNTVPFGCGGGGGGGGLAEADCSGGNAGSYGAGGGGAGDSGVQSGGLGFQGLIVVTYNPPPPPPPFDSPSISFSKRTRVIAY